MLTEAGLTKIEINRYRRKLASSTAAYIGGVEAAARAEDAHADESRAAAEQDAAEREALRPYRSTLDLSRPFWDQPAGATAGSPNPSDRGVRPAASSGLSQGLLPQHVEYVANQCGLSWFVIIFCGLPGIIFGGVSAGQGCDVDKHTHNGDHVAAKYAPGQALNAALAGIGLGLIQHAGFVYLYEKEIWLRLGQL